MNESVVNPLLCYVPICPLIGAALVYGLTRRAPNLSGWVATAASACGFLLTLKLFLSLGYSDGAAISATAWEWLNVGTFHANFSFRFDHLAAVMTLIVTGVGTLIHLYAIGYMAEDENKPRFFCYLNLFLFAMLLLVLGDNLPVMFVGWEGVGLCSYLLIGFWYKEMANAEAGQKAFVVNRIGDAGFILGIFTIFVSTGTVSFQDLQPALQFVPPGTIELIAFLLFIGAMGKSAQIPLYVWLPDAMAGPTPVSALIHAATMVTAGVYMIARMSFLFALAPHASIFIGIIGATTAIFAASIALVQCDIKKVLAYSTVSQLGYMFMAMGAGAYSNGIFHVVTHAFFKACLFMGAGSVIMGCHHEQDMRHFGGLRKLMPVTFATYLIATLAIAGFPGLSGFYSKDAILWSVFSDENPASHVIIFGAHLNHILWGMGFVTALMTAFYMTRSLALTFFGDYRGHAHPHESPLVVTIPLLVLALLSAVFGYFYGETLLEYLGPWTRADLRPHGEHPHAEEILEMASIGVALLGILGAGSVYIIRPGFADRAAQIFPKLYRTLMGKWWIDELYNRIVIAPLGAISSFFFTGIDRAVIDASVNGTAFLVESEGRATSGAHTGQIAHYLLAMFFGMIVLTVFWLLLA